jgi:outer membrane protein insertion porin family
LLKEQNIRITAIEIKGNDQVPASEILAEVRSKVGDPLLEPRLRSDVQAIYETGYFTDVKVDTPYYAGGVRIVFRVQENPKVTKIVITGNKLVSIEKLRSLIQTKEGKILNLKTLSADMNEVNYYYNETLGYQVEPTHIKNVTWTPQGELLLVIQEGLDVKEVKVVGSSLYTEEKLKTFVHLKPGVLFNSKVVKEDSSRMSKFYEDEGYYLDTIRPQVDFKTGIITYQIIETIVEDIRVEFDKEKHKTKNETVTRSIRTKPGEVLQRVKLLRDIERLQNLGYFSKVSPDTEPGSKPGYVNLVFRLQEQKTGLATIGVGYAGGGSGALRSGITGMISMQEKNLGGTGQAVSAAWQRGVNIDALNASYFNPAINKNQDSFAFNVFRQNYLQLQQPVTNTDPNKPQYALYDDLRSGISLSYGRRITDDFRMFLSHRREYLEIKQNPSSENPVIGVSSGLLSALALGTLFDNRNDIFDPTTGAYVDASFTYGGHFLAGSYDFTKYQAEMRKYFPLGAKKKSAIALRAWGGLIKGTTPITENFYVGGTDTIRGYTENSFYGTRMVVLNAEFRFPFGNIPYLKGAIFADAGNAWTPGITRSKLYKDAGAGLRIVFPTLGLGVIRVDYAIGENKGRTSIGIGQTF